jgi:D-apionolactonase
MDDAVRLLLYGTTEPPAQAATLTAGPLAVTLAQGAIGAVTWHGVEVLRGIAYPIRNSDWGTFKDETIEERCTASTYVRRFTAADGAITGAFSLEVNPAGTLSLGVELAAARDIEVNRAGFVMLHPIAGLAGTPLAVTHASGAVEQTTFPELISPSQPVLDIAKLVQSANGVTAEIVFSGETFEMEDQRNWSDASYKTYGRPLSLPYPYLLAAGETVIQRIEIRLSGNPSSLAAADAEGLILRASEDTVPAIDLVLEPGWACPSPALELLGNRATRLRLDLSKANELGPLLASVYGALEVEVVVDDDPASLDAQLSTFAQLGLKPHAIGALPRAYLASYQPGSTWPTGATPTDGAHAVRRHFPGVPVIGGMLTNFTELNRHRAAATSGDILSHGTTAIVHAADDLSVLQTLEALPQIFASAQALAPGRPYRLGLVSIGMRSNPYGSRLADNPHNRRVPMAATDPRQCGLFAAAWMVGAVAATAGSAVDSLALAAPDGPFGLLDELGQPHPAFHAFRALARLSGRRRLALGLAAPFAGVAAEIDGRANAVIANLGAAPRAIHLGAEAQSLLLDHRPGYANWLDQAPRRTAHALTLPPFAVAILRFTPGLQT